MSKYLFIAHLKDESYLGNKAFNEQIPIGGIVELIVIPHPSKHNKRYIPLDLPITSRELKESFREIK